MIDGARGGEAGYWARRVQYARETRLLSGLVSRPPARKTSDELDPHKRPAEPHELVDERLYYADQTPGLDEAHCRPGHPLYRPTGGPR